MITQDRAEQALDFLINSADEFGERKGALERSEILRKRARKGVFLTCEGSSVAMKEALAETSQNALEADETYCAALIAYEKLKAKREIEQILIDVWRTNEASRRRG
jgi:hypothetical protein